MKNIFSKAMKVVIFVSFLVSINAVVYGASSSTISDGSITENMSCKVLTYSWVAASGTATVNDVKSTQKINGVVIRITAKSTSPSTAYTVKIRDEYGAYIDGGALASVSITEASWTWPFDGTNYGPVSIHGYLWLEVTQDATDGTGFVYVDFCE